MTQKPYTLSLNKSVVESSKKLKGDISLSKYVENALKTYNMRVAAKKRFENTHKDQIEQEVKKLERQPEMIEQMQMTGVT